MSNPVRSDVVAVNPVLTNLLVGYAQADNRFIASQVAVPVPVTTSSGTYFIFDKRYWFSNEMKPRAYGAPYARGGFALTSDTYVTAQKALDHPIPDELRADSQVPMDLEQAALKWLAQQHLIAQEISFAAAMMVTGVWGTSNTTATDWDDYATGDPVTDIATAKLAISNNTGYEPNSLVMGQVVHNAIANHPDILDRIKYVNQASQANVNSALLAVFGLERWIVGKASYNAGNEASAMTTGTAIVDDDALLCYINPGAGRFDATCAKTFHWAPGGGMGGARMVRDDSADSDVIKSKQQLVQEIVASDLGYIFLDIV